VPWVTACDSAPLTLLDINKLHPPPAPLSTISTHQNAQTGQHHNPDAPRGDADETPAARVLIVHASPSTAGAGAGAGYVGLMNCVFAAQKSVRAVCMFNVQTLTQSQKIPIDVLNLPDTDSIFLQQAAHLTAGVYWRCPSEQRPGILQFLHVCQAPTSADFGGRH
jgi:transcription initiation factor TFIIH subunit 3